MANKVLVMQNYEAKKPSYFATPSPQLIHALHTSLTQILSKPLAERFAIHKATSQKIKQAVADLGLKQLAAKPEDQANGMTAIYLPEGVAAPQLLPNLLNKGVIFAGGLHKEIATKYIRLGHMGVSVVSSKFSAPQLQLFGSTCRNRVVMTNLFYIDRSQAH
jgi:alanine-glyoxylate transaminase/serine-glyoxylate transaminase/serine-pyruvate transaminase